MNYQQSKEQREGLNRLMAQQDSFFQQFGELDTQVYAEGAISKKNKELMGLAVSVATRCNECITYHLGGCIENGAVKEEVLEAVKIGVIGGGSITYPNARHAIAVMKEIGFIE